MGLMDRNDDGRVGPGELGRTAAKTGWGLTMLQMMDEDGDPGSGGGTGGGSGGGCGQAPGCGQTPVDCG